MYYRTGEAPSSQSPISLGTATSTTRPSGFSESVVKVAKTHPSSQHNTIKTNNSSPNATNGYSNQTVGSSTASSLPPLQPGALLPFSSSFSSSTGATRTGSSRTVGAVPSAQSMSGSRKVSDDQENGSTRSRCSAERLTQLQPLSSRLQWSDVTAGSASPANESKSGNVNGYSVCTPLHLTSSPLATHDFVETLFVVLPVFSAAEERRASPTKLSSSTSGSKGSGRKNGKRTSTDSDNSSDGKGTAASSPMAPMDDSVKGKKDSRRRKERHSKKKHGKTQEQQQQDGTSSANTAFANIPSASGIRSINGQSTEDYQPHAYSLHGSPQRLPSRSATPPLQSSTNNDSSHRRGAGSKNMNINSTNPVTDSMGSSHMRRLRRSSRDYATSNDSGDAESPRFSFSVTLDDGTPRPLSRRTSTLSARQQEALQHSPAFLSRQHTPPPTLLQDQLGNYKQHYSLPQSTQLSRKTTSNSVGGSGTGGDDAAQELFSLGFFDSGNFPDDVLVFESAGSGYVACPTDADVVSVSNSNQRRRIGGATASHGKSTNTYATLKLVRRSSVTSNSTAAGSPRASVNKVPLTLPLEVSESRNDIARVNVSLQQQQQQNAASPSPPLNASDSSMGIIHIPDSLAGIADSSFGTAVWHSMGAPDTLSTSASLGTIEAERPFDMNWSVQQQQQQQQQVRNDMLGEDHSIRPPPLPQQQQQQQGMPKQVDTTTAFLRVPQPHASTIPSNVKEVTTAVSVDTASTKQENIKVPLKSSHSPDLSISVGSDDLKQSYAIFSNSPKGNSSSSIKNEVKRIITVAEEEKPVVVVRKQKPQVQPQPWSQPPLQPPSPSFSSTGFQKFQQLKKEVMRPLMSAPISSTPPITSLQSRLELEPSTPPPSSAPVSFCVANHAHNSSPHMETMRALRNGGAVTKVSSGTSSTSAQPPPPPLPPPKLAASANAPSTPGPHMDQSASTNNASKHSNSSTTTNSAEVWKQSQSNAVKASSNRDRDHCSSPRHTSAPSSLSLPPAKQQQQQEQKSPSSSTHSITPSASSTPPSPSSPAITGRTNTTATVRAAVAAAQRQPQQSALSVPQAPTTQAAAASTPVPLSQVSSSSAPSVEAASAFAASTTKTQPQQQSVKPVAPAQRHGGKQVGIFFDDDDGEVPSIGLIQESRGGTPRPHQQPPVRGPLRVGAEQILRSPDNDKDLIAIKQIVYYDNSDGEEEETERDDGLLDGFRPDDFDRKRGFRKSSNIVFHISCDDSVSSTDVFAGDSIRQLSSDTRGMKDYGPVSISLTNQPGQEAKPLPRPKISYAQYSPPDDSVMQFMPMMSLPSTGVPYRPIVTPSTSSLNGTVRSGGAGAATNSSVLLLRNKPSTFSRVAQYNKEPYDLQLENTTSTLNIDTSSPPANGNQGEGEHPTFSAPQPEYYLPRPILSIFAGTSSKYKPDPAKIHKPIANTFGQRNGRCFEEEDRAYEEDEEGEWYWEEVEDEEDEEDEEEQGDCSSNSSDSGIWEVRGSGAGMQAVHV